MTLGNKIRTYRKMKNMTQDEMARRLGVSAPAVNKWEKEVSMPDITLLAPIARLLDISLDELLSFRENLSTEEIRQYILEADQMFQEQSYEEAYGWIKKKVAEYPNCDKMILQFATILDAQRMFQGIEKREEYDEYILSLYERGLDSSEEDTRIMAAEAISNYYMREENYEKAEEYLAYLSIQNPERKRRQAVIYGETGRIEEAYKTYEELLFSYYQLVSVTMIGIYQLALQEKDMKKAHALVKKQAELARIFEMGRYYEVSAELELATIEKEEEKVLFMMEEMLGNVADLGDFRRSGLYEHMEFKATEPGFAKRMRENLIQCFLDEENYEFLKGKQKKLFEGKNWNSNCF